MTKLLCLASVSTLLLACGGDPDNFSGGPDASPGTTPDGANPDGWSTLIDAEWTLGNMTEEYRCVRLTIDRDIWIDGFDAIAPDGTHHTVLTVGAPSGPDGVTPCQAFNNHNSMMFGSGVGTGQLDFPEGVAVRLRAGQQLLLNLHLFNVSPGELSGTSGIRVHEVSESDVVNEAEAVLMGPLDLSIDPGADSEMGGCTFSNAATIFAVGPHMHQLGTHMTVTARRAAGDVEIHNKPYDFEVQQIERLETMTEMQPGDSIEVVCDYMNTTNMVINWGDSSLAEMCFAGIYRYPATSNNFICSNL